MNEYKQIKVALIGAAGVGKSSLARLLARESFEHTYTSTIGVNAKFVYLHEEKVKIAVWDLSGQERFKNIIKNFIKTCDMIVFCYAVDDSSYKDMMTLYEL